MAEAVVQTADEFREDLDDYLILLIAENSDAARELRMRIERHIKYNNLSKDTMNELINEVFGPGRGGQQSESIKKARADLIKHTNKKEHNHQGRRSSNKKRFRKHSRKHSRKYSRKHSRKC